MFVLVVDTSLMNVSISEVVKDLDTKVERAVQTAIALEALVSAAFILISSKIGDLFGRKRAYVLGLLGYAVGAVAMTLAQSLAAIIIFWAIIGGLGASLLLPAMQSLIHGNFEGAAQKKTYALIGAAAAIAAAVGPLLGGFITTYLSWRVGFLLEAVVIAVVLSQVGLIKDVPYTGERKVDAVGAALSVLGMGGVVLGILVWQEGGDYVVLLIAIGALALWALSPLARAPASRGPGDPARSGPVPAAALQGRDQRADAAEHHARRGHDLAADLPAAQARVRRPSSRSVTRPALADDVRRSDPRRAQVRWPAPRKHHPDRVRARRARPGADPPGRARGGLRLVPLRSRW